MSERLRTAPKSYLYEDPETGRIFPGMVDSSMFEQEVFDSSFRYGNDTGAKVCLTDGELKCRYVNRKRYDWWSPLVSYDQYLSLRRRTLATVVKGDDLKREMMETEVVIKVE
ncbi:hypothetical protein GF351_01835 [Candidatus Woesearchaeota archaeon]|nr:hypothetical protein [Candidatus Woesearchaeota archaeon]